MNQTDVYLNLIQEEELQEIDPATMAVVTGVFYGASIANMAFKAYKVYFSKAARRCKDLPGQEKSLCMIQAKIIGKNAELAKLRGGMSKCNKVKKGPEKCLLKLKTKLSKVSQEIKFLQKRIKQLGKQKYKGD